MADFIKLYEHWTADGALEMKVLKADETSFDFDITRCRYAETYKEMGLGKIGHLLSCNRDGTFCQGYDPNITLERKQTIMEGAPCCTFRYRYQHRGSGNVALDRDQVGHGAALADGEKRRIVRRCHRRP